MTLDILKENKAENTKVDDVTVGEGVQETLEQLEFSLKRSESFWSHESLFEFYMRLPHPRARHLPLDQLHRLLDYLSFIERKDEKSKMRYLSVVDDVKAVGLPLDVKHWTSAIAYVGRCLKRISDVEVQEALGLWREMESEAGVKANEVTFNVLFDIATKAGKYILADMILREMEHRGHRMNRYFRVGTIYYHGQKRNGAGVRQAYRDLVEAGEIVDTPVLNCVISSLLACGEVGAAEHTFARMKRLHKERHGSRFSPSVWIHRKQIPRIQVELSSRIRDNTEALRPYQDEAIIAPDYRTYRLLVRYIAVTLGDMDRVTELVNEMGDYEIPLSGTIFLNLFIGFAKHGGQFYTSWTLDRLEVTCSAFMAAVSSPKEKEVFLSKSAVGICLWAYRKCAGNERMLQIWELLLDRWNPSDDELLETQNLLEKLQAMTYEDAFSPRGIW